MNWITVWMVLMGCLGVGWGQGWSNYADIRTGNGETMQARCI
jgi:hypothetical protein